MVLDYISAHIAVSSSDLRRMVPFRRRNEFPNNRTLDPPSTGFMNVGLSDSALGADPMVENFAIQAGNMRAFEKPNYTLIPGDINPARPRPWAIASNGRAMTMEAVSNYRLPHSINDLFVNDRHRRFFQRLHRVPHYEEVASGRNCDNMEIYASSPSYLITAGGSPAPWAVFPHIAEVVEPGGQDDQLGVAVTTSFMPTTQLLGGAAQNASELIQFSTFSQAVGAVENYGVAPDFACGQKVYLPNWVPGRPDRGFIFIDRRYHGRGDIPGFYLAIYLEGDFGCMEAFDTWLHPELGFEEFKSSVVRRNPDLHLRNNVEAIYTTQNGNKLHFIIWSEVDGDGDRATSGARILNIEYSEDGDRNDTLIDAGNDTNPFLSGTVMKSTADAVVEITNPGLNTKLTLDMRDLWHPTRISETGEVEKAGSNHEVWVDFDWSGPSEGDFYRPFTTIAAATAAVADGGVIKIVPGHTPERTTIGGGKRMKLVAPIGGVIIGIQ